MSGKYDNHLTHSWKAEKTSQRMFRSVNFLTEHRIIGFHEAESIRQRIAQVCGLELSLDGRSEDLPAQQGNHNEQKEVATQGSYSNAPAMSGSGPSPVEAQEQPN